MFSYYVMSELMPGPHCMIELLFSMHGVNFKVSEMLCMIDRLDLGALGWYTLWII